MFGITKGGAGTLILNGTAANLYTGTTTVNTGTLLLNDSGGVAISGNLSVGDHLGGQGVTKADVVRLLASNQILPAGTVTIDASGLLDLNGFNNTIGTTGVNALTNSGGSITTGTGVLTLGGNVSGVAATYDITPATISGNLNLGGATRIIDVQAGGLAGLNPNGTVQSPGVTFLYPNTNDMNISAVITNGSLTKNNTGKLQLSGANTYNGATTVNAGTLYYDGSDTTTTTTVNTSGVLAGVGSIGPVILNGGTVKPGDSPGKLTVKSLTYNSGTLDIQLPATGTPGVNYDQLVVTTALTLGASSSLTLDLSGLTTTGVFTQIIKDTGGAITGTFPPANVTVINNPNNWNVFVDYSQAASGIINVDVFGTASKLAFTTQPSNTAAGAAISPAVQVTVEDSFNTVIPSDNTDVVTVGIASGPGSFTGSSTTTVTASSGIATFSNLVLNTAGTYTLSETASFGTGPASNSFTVSPGTAEQTRCAFWR